MAHRQTLRVGSKGPNVIELQKMLNKAITPSPALKVDGDFGENTKKAILQFQKKAKITIDGLVGKRTWKALADAINQMMTSPLPQFQLADIASQYIGVRETGNNRAGKSKKMLEIFKADNLVVNGKTDGYPWCAAFVSLCVQKLCQQSIFYSALTPPREPSVSRFLNSWAKQNDCMIFKPNDKDLTAVKGDIVVFTFSHIGIIDSNNGSVVTTIEGNTNAAGSREGVCVARKIRINSLIKAFIRLPISKLGIDRYVDDAVRYC